MLGEVERGLAARISGERLERNMSSEVERLSDDVRQSASLGGLQASVLASLDRMQAHVREHIEDENQRRSEAEAEVQALREQLHAVEHNAFDLRRQDAQTQEQAMRDALRVADAMRAAVEQGGLHASGRPVNVTVSGGLSLFAGGDSAGAVFERADRALYRAKRQGKNRIVVA